MTTAHGMAFETKETLIFSPRKVRESVQAKATIQANASESIRRVFTNVDRGPLRTRKNTAAAGKSNRNCALRMSNSSCQINTQMPASNREIMQQFSHTEVALNAIPFSWSAVVGFFNPTQHPQMPKRSQAAPRILEFKGPSAISVMNK